AVMITTGTTARGIEGPRESAMMPARRDAETRSPRSRRKILEGPPAIQSPPVLRRPRNLGRDLAACPRARKNLSPGHHPSGGRVSPLHARQPSRYALAAGSSPEETGTLFPPAPRDQTRSAARCGARGEGRAAQGRRPGGPRAPANRARAPALTQGPARGSISIEPE